jgi:hypothetical protein
MSEAVSSSEIMEELRAIREEISQMREEMPDKDMFLTAEESRLLHESHENEKCQKLVSSKDLRKKLGL